MANTFIAFDQVANDLMVKINELAEAHSVNPYKLAMMLGASIGSPGCAEAIEVDRE